MTASAMPLHIGKCERAGKWAACFIFDGGWILGERLVRKVSKRGQR